MEKITRFDTQCFKKAIAAAKEVYRFGNYPVGAVLAIDNEVIAMGGNERIRDKHGHKSYINHAEILLIIKYGDLLSEAYKQRKIISLYSTLEPCIQCLGASVTNHINRILFIETDPNGGACNLRHDNIGVWYEEVWPEIMQCSISKEPKKLMIQFFHNEIKKGNTEWPEKMLRLLKVT
jgi:tRNA(Arg) A34 adenosine deaminase TadA